MSDGQKEGVPPRRVGPCFGAFCMSDLSFFDPPIEIAAGGARQDMIMSRLKASGLRPYPASHPIDFGAADPLLIDIATVSREVLEGFSRAEMVQVHRQVVLVDLSDDRTPVLGDAVILRRDQDLGGLKSRLMALARRDSRLREACARRETAASLGFRFPAADLNSVPSLLYIGEGSPLFLSLQSPLKQRGLEVTAAISLETARQHMSGHRFAAALVDLESFRDEDSRTAQWIAEEQGLGALPVIVLSHPGAQLTERQNAVVAMATEVVDAAGRMAAIVSQIETVCRKLVAFAPIMPRPALTSILSDFTTGLFSRRFIEAHIGRQMDIASERAEPLCVVTFRLDPSQTISLAAQRAFADIIRAQIRDADCPALMQPGLFAISLPATPYRGGSRLAERVADLAARHPVIGGPGFGWRVIEKRAYHTPQTLLDAGTTGPWLRPSLAA